MHAQYYDIRTGTVNTWQTQSAPSERFPYGLGLNNDEYVIGFGIFPYREIHEDYDELTQELVPDSAPTIENGEAVLTYRPVTLPPKIDTRTLAEHRAAKLTELAASFSAAEANGCLLSSTGFEIDATERANRDISGLVTVLSQDGAPQSTYFCDHSNIMHPVTLADLKIMQLEIIAYGQALYARKWEIRSAIEASETVEDVQTIVISFEATA